MLIPTNICHKSVQLQLGLAITNIYASRSNYMTLHVAAYHAHAYRRAHNCKIGLINSDVRQTVTKNGL